MHLNEIRGHGTRDPGVAEQGGDVMRARLGPTLKFSEHDLSMIQMVYDPGLDPIETDEAKSAHDLFGRKKTGELPLVPKTVLQGQHNTGRADQWGQEAGKLIVGRGLERDDNKIGNANVFRHPGAFRPGSKVTLRAANENAVSPDRIVIGSKQKMNLLTGAGQPSSIKAAHRPGPYDSDFHKPAE
jgi:hypothetical protein